MFCKISVFLFVILELISTRVGYGFINKFENMQMQRRHGVLTSYKYIGNNDTSEIHFPGCEAEKIWMFVRHGARYPFESTMKHILTELPKIQRNIESTAFDDIKRWKPLFRWHDHGKMMTSGNDELMQLGKRFRLRFPSLIKKNCADNIYKYKSTDTQRTKQSAKQFGIGFLGEKLHSRCWLHEPKDKHLVLEFYNYCDKWIEDVRNNNEMKKKEGEFIASKHVRKMLTNISNRIGYKVNIRDVSLIGQACAYENAFHDNKRSSPWCTLLLPDELETLEFMNDLYSYWVHGYGIPLTYQQACPVMNDVFHFFRSEHGGKVMAYFGHDTAMWKIVAFLGIAKDKHPLRSDSYIKSKNRKWKSSFISPFAANVAFVSYKCDESSEPSILFLHQEHIVPLPGCPAIGPCPFHIMKKLYAAHDDECKLEELCAI